MFPLALMATSQKNGMKNAIVKVKVMFFLKLKFKDKNKTNKLHILFAWLSNSIKEIAVRSKEVP